MKIVPVPRTITVSSLIAGTYAPPAAQKPITAAICGIPLRRHPRLVEEDPPEVLAVREDVVLERQIGAARVDEVDARQPVLLGDLLRAQVLLDRKREVRAALDGRVVRDDHALPALDDSDPGHDPGRRCLSVVHLPRGERVQLQERRTGIDEPVDPLARRELPARAVPFHRHGAAARRDQSRPLAQFGDERLDPRMPAHELVRTTVDMRHEQRHQPAETVYALVSLVSWST